MAYAIRHNHRGQVQAASGLDLLAGIWLFISAFVIRSGPTMAWNNGILAVVIAILAAVRTFGAYQQTWISWINVVLGVWVLISPWVLMRTPGQPMIWNNVITGVVVIILAGWSALASGGVEPEASRTMPPSPTR